ncbi:hypothetical protein D9M71_547380 [compost metagenome]
MTWQVAAHAPVVQGQFKAGWFAGKQLFVHRQRLFITAGNRQQTRLLQAPRRRRLLKFKQACGLTCLQAARRHGTDPRTQLLGFTAVLLAQCQAQGRQQYLRVARLKQLQTAQRIAHQVVTVQRFATAYLVQQPLALFIDILGLCICLAGYCRQHQHADHSLHGALQAGNRRPCGSKR